MMNRIFVATFGETKNELLAMIKNSRDFTNNFELRFDLCGDWKFQEKNLRELFPAAATVIFTDRSETFPLTRGARGVDNKHEKVTRGDFFTGFELVDFDLQGNPSPDLVHDKNLSKSGLLVSAHIFEKFSREKTAETVQKLLQIPAKFHKLAVNLDTWEDLQEFVALSKNLEQRKWILVGMGEFGKISRGIFARLGFATFAGMKNYEVAPGQIDLETLNNLLS